MKYSTQSIKSVLAPFPSAQLSLTPTPIYKLLRLSAHVGRNVYIMRDDLTGFGLGGNKIRKLDYLIADAIAVQADTLITSSASSFSRNAAAAGRALGFDVHVVLAGPESRQNSTSQAFFQQFGTRLYYVPEGDAAALTAKHDEVAEELRAAGRKVYELHPGGSDRIGALGYINAFDQIVQYSRDSGVHFARIVHATGSTATQVGLLLGKRISDYETAITGMAISRKAEVQAARVDELATETADMLGLQFDPDEIHVDDGFLGGGYSIPSKDGTDAKDMFANLEGVLLDDSYTGKAAAGLIHYATSGAVAEGENVLFVHTGGNAGLYY